MQLALLRSVGAMRLSEIPRERWVERLNAFTVAYHGWLATLAVFGGETGARAQVTNMPLIGVSAERANHEPSVAVSVAQSAEAPVTHVIDRVTHIYAGQPMNGTAAALVIESKDATHTVLRVRSAAGGRGAAHGATSTG